MVHLNRWIFHIDMDAFFASVEQYRNHPDLVGLPVCVGHDPKEGRGRGVVRAASYEAREKGIRSGMPVSEAYRLCPEAHFIQGEFSSYIEASDEFMEILSDFGDDGRVRRASIDEAYIETTFRCQEYNHPRDLAEEIQKTVKKETLLPCSIGIASSISVAKIATGINKPMGITFVPQDPKAILEFLAPLPVSAVNGIGRVTSERLKKYGIETLGQIQEMDIPTLWPIMGRSSKWLLNRASGVDNRPLIDNGPRVRKSISKDRTFVEDVDPESTQYLHQAIENICSRIGERLKSKDLSFKTVTVKIRYGNYETIQRSKSIPVATSNPRMLEKLAREIFDAKRNMEKPIRLLGVKISGLKENEAQVLLTQFY
jgi:DNA polymerase IV (DinB-like DNA polymerase)